MLNFKEAKRRIKSIEIGQVIIAICIVFLFLLCAYNVKEILIKYERQDTVCWPK